MIKGNSPKAVLILIKTGYKIQTMLTNSFIHIQSIGAITEQRLWESGIRDWDSFSGDLPIPISAGRNRGHPIEILSREK
jgi:hypothetical protein